MHPENGIIETAGITQFAVFIAQNLTILSTSPRSVQLQLCEYHTVIIRQNSILQGNVPHHTSITDAIRKEGEIV